MNDMGKVKVKDSRDLKSTLRRVKDDKDSVKATKKLLKMILKAE